MHPHELAFIQHLVEPRLRARYMSKGGVIRNNLYHNPGLKPGVEVPLPPPMHTAKQLIAVLGRLTTATACVVIGNHLDRQEITLAEAAQWLFEEHRDGTILSIEPGRLALWIAEYASESCFLIAEAPRRRLAQAVFAELFPPGTTKHGRAQR